MLACCAPTRCRVTRLDHPQTRYKVDINATENRLTGVCLIVPDRMALVVVEGCSKSQNRYHKLMTRRINWNMRKENGVDVVDEEGPDRCALVWQGTAKASRVVLRGWGGRRAGGPLPAF